jgi:hypothetical protein
LPSAFFIHVSQAWCSVWPFVLDREVDDRGGAAEGGGDRPGGEVVGRVGPAERHVEVRVHVDAAGQHVLSGGIDRLVGVNVGERRSDDRDLFVLDQHVSLVLIDRSDNRAVPNQCAHAIARLKPSRSEDSKPQPPAPTPFSVRTSD